MTHGALGAAHLAKAAPTRGRRLLPAVVVGGGSPSLWLGHNRRGRAP